MRSLPLIVALVACGGPSPVDVPVECRDELLVGGLFLGTEPHAPLPEVRAEAEAVVFLARVVDLADPAANLVEDADRVVLEGASGPVDLRNDGRGVYLTDSVDDPALRYEVGSEAGVSVQTPYGSGEMRAVAPPPPRIDLPPPGTHPPDGGLAIDLSGQGYDLAHVRVVDADEAVVWQSVENNVWDQHAWLRSEETCCQVWIDGSAFPDPGARYAVAVAGIRRAAPEA